MIYLALVWARARIEAQRFSPTPPNLRSTHDQWETYIDTFYSFWPAPEAESVQDPERKVG